MKHELKYGRENKPFTKDLEKNRDEVLRRVFRLTLIFIIDIPKSLLKRD